MRPSPTITWKRLRWKKLPFYHINSHICPSTDRQDMTWLTYNENVQSLSLSPRAPAKRETAEDGRLLSLPGGYSILAAFVSLVRTFGMRFALHRCGVWGVGFAREKYLGHDVWLRRRAPDICPPTPLMPRFAEGWARHGIFSF